MSDIFKVHGCVIYQTNRLGKPLAIMFEPLMFHVVDHKITKIIDNIKFYPTSGANKCKH